MTPPEVTDAEIIRLYHTEGLSMLAVARKTGAGYERVRSTVEQAGVKREFHVSDAKAAAILAACTEEGMTQAQAAARFRTGPAAVSRVLRKHGMVAGKEEGLLTASEAARLAGVTVRDMSVLARAGAVGYVRRTARGHRLYVAADVKALAARRQRPGQDGADPAPEGGKQ